VPGTQRSLPFSNLEATLKEAGGPAGVRNDAHLALR